MSDRPDSGALRELALATAREAGELILRLRAEGVEVAGTKSSAIDIVTRADQAAEALIKRRLLGARPDDGMVGEEGDDLRGHLGRGLDRRPHRRHRELPLRAAALRRQHRRRGRRSRSSPGWSWLRRSSSSTSPRWAVARPATAGRSGPGQWSRWPSGWSHRFQLRAARPRPAGGVHRPAAAAGPRPPPARLLRSRPVRGRLRHPRRLCRGGAAHLGPRRRRTGRLGGGWHPRGRSLDPAANGC